MIIIIIIVVALDAQSKLMRNNCISPALHAVPKREYSQCPADVQATVMKLAHATQRTMQRTMQFHA